MEIFSIEHLDDQKQKSTLNKTPISFKCDQKWYCFFTFLSNDIEPLNDFQKGTVTMYFLCVTFAYHSPPTCSI